MWDVIWTDPDKELVGEHRAKKEKGETQTKTLKARSGRQSVSTSSSRSCSSTDSPFNIFRSKALRRTDKSSSNSNMASSLSSGFDSPLLASSRSPESQIRHDGSHRSSGRTCSSLFERRSPAGKSLNISRLADRTDEDYGKQFLNLSADEHVFSTSPFGNLAMSNPTDDDVMTKPEKVNNLMQILGPSSTIAKQAELCLSKTNASGANVTPERLRQGRLTPPVSPTKRPSKITNRLELDAPVLPVPPSKAYCQNPLPEWHLPIMPNSPAAWKPPEQWDTIKTETHRRLQKKKRVDNCKNKPLPRIASGLLQDFDSVYADLTKMATTSAPDILPELKAFWSSCSKKDTQFYLSQKEALEKQRRWMFSAMTHMDQILGSPSKRLVPRKESPMTARMVLGLYDSLSIVTYLAALDPTKQVYYLSTADASVDESFRNVRKIPVSSIAPTEFPVAPRLFEMVHSLQLPSLCQDSLLPRILGSVQRCLKIGGSCKLVLIDPLPRSVTLGIRLKGWIEEHLLRNLAKQGKCMSPSTVFPPLLAEAGLRGKGSTITTTKFYALPESAESREREQEETAENLRVERVAKAQVRSLVGRMLWMEVWGPYVTAGKWWWDDPACVRECLELGTFWEYHMVKGVKGP